MQKVTPFLMFDGQAEEAARFYVSLLPDSRIDRVTRSPTDTPGGAAGTVLTVEFTLAGCKFIALNGHRNPFNDAVSFQIHCADQAEVDRLWAALSAGGSEVACGWLRDRWGLSWQVTPTRLYELLNDADPDRSRAGDAGDDDDGQTRHCRVGACRRWRVGITRQQTKGVGSRIEAKPGRTGRCSRPGPRSRRRAVECPCPRPRGLSWVFGKKVEGTVNVDPAKLELFMGKMIGHMTGGTLCYSIWLGDELGLYRELAGTGPRDADSVAAKTGCNARLVREWLDAQAAGGLVAYDPAADTYELSPEAALALADDGSPVFLARAMNAVGSMFLDVQKVAAAFRGSGALAWGEHHPCLFCGTEWFFRTGYRAYLTTQWIPALDGVEAKLRAGARVADVGCGHGASVVAMAAAYPNSTFCGFDFHAPSVETASRRAAEAGVGGRARFEVASATGYTGRFDLICFFDCLHDMGDPVGAARHAREHLAPGGTVLLVEPFALDGRPRNIAGNPMAALMYVASASICTPNSLSQEVGLALGAQAGEARLREVFADAGFTHFRRAAQTPMNLIIEARA